MAGIPLLKKDKNGNIIIFFHKSLYRYSVISDLLNSVEGICLDASLKKYFRLKLETKDSQKALGLCNYLFSEHR